MSRRSCVQSPVWSLFCTLTVADAGWLDSSPDSVEMIDPKGFVPITENTGSQWSSLIQSIRKLIIADRSKNLPTEASKPFRDIKGISCGERAFFIHNKMCTVQQ